MWLSWNTETHFVVQSGLKLTEFKRLLSLLFEFWVSFPPASLRNLT